MPPAPGAGSRCHPQSSPGPPVLTRPTNARPPRIDTGGSRSAKGGDIGMCARMCAVTFQGPRNMRKLRFRTSDYGLEEPALPQSLAGARPDPGFEALVRSALPLHEDAAACPHCRERQNLNRRVAEVDPRFDRHGFSSGDDGFIAALSLGQCAWHQCSPFGLRVEAPPFVGVCVPNLLPHTTTVSVHMFEGCG